MFPAVAGFLKEQGRMKYLRPLYKVRPRARTADADAAGRQSLFFYEWLQVARWTETLCSRRGGEGKDSEGI